jgi:hypothetical protein
MPAQAGIQGLRLEEAALCAAALIPAFAGMTRAARDDKSGSG